MNTKQVSLLPAKSLELMSRCKEMFARGAAMRELVKETGYSQTRLFHLLKYSMAKHGLKRFCTGSQMRYFSDAEVGAAWDAERIVIAAANKAIRDLESTRRRRAKEALARASRPPKPPKVMKPPKVRAAKLPKPPKPPKPPKEMKVCMPKTHPRPSTSALQRWKTTEAANPRNVKPQVLPCGRDTRFTVPPTHRGDFSRLGVGRYLEAA